MENVKDIMSKEIECCSLLDNMYEVAVKMKELNVAGELWREYEFGPSDNRTVYRISNPVTVFYREGGTTHRVVDDVGVVHLVPAIGHNGCIARWKNAENLPRCRF